MKSKLWRFRSLKLMRQNAKLHNIPYADWITLIAKGSKRPNTGWFLIAIKGAFLKVEHFLIIFCMCFDLEFCLSSSYSWVCNKCFQLITFKLLPIFANSSTPKSVLSWQLSFTLIINKISKHFHIICNPLHPSLGCHIPFSNNYFRWCKGEVYWR